MRLIGFEAGGDGIATGRHAATLVGGSSGILHGMRTYLLQDADGQTLETHSISAGLDYPGVGPEHAWLRDTGRATYRAVTDQQAMDAFLLLCREEGIIPALESAHALAGALDIGRELGPDGIMLVNLSGRGDKDVDTAARWLHMTADAARGARDRGRGAWSRSGRCRHRRGGNAAVNAVSAVFEKAAADGRAALVGYLPAGFPSVDGAIAAATAMAQAGADMIEIGLPYTDPLIDGPVIQEAVHRALTGGVRTVDVLRTVQALASAEVARARHDLLEPRGQVRRGRICPRSRLGGGRGHDHTRSQPGGGRAVAQRRGHLRARPGVRGRAKLD